MVHFDRPVAVPYYRVSTQKQGQSGLGLDAQRAAVEAFCRDRGLSLEEGFTEVESGKRSDRVELRKAFAKARRLRGVVVIAKLDRLARNVHFVSGLIKQGVAFTCVDAPDDDAFMLHIRASVAEDEARKISTRTKDSLAAAKSRGVKLGTPGNFTNEGRAIGSRNGAAAMKRKASESHAELLPEIIALRASGETTRSIAAKLGTSPMTVSRLLRRATEGK